ncbi:MAG: flagellar biosynthesis anti-sigma factor FlgM [Methylovulum sp.]|nr:flagellar biosynthesis anti-sigma factor FlgM [Methylovulum sp.]
MTIESITGRTQMPTAIKVATKAEADNGQKAAINNTENKGDIAITTMAQGIKKAFESSSATSSVDLDRVNSVKKALAEGSYPINAERIAKKMIQFEMTLP